MVLPYFVSVLKSQKQYHHKYLILVGIIQNILFLQKNGAAFNFEWINQIWQHFNIQAEPQLWNHVTNFVRIIE